MKLQKGFEKVLLNDNQESKQGIFLSFVDDKRTKAKIYTTDISYIEIFQLKKCLDDYLDEHSKEMMNKTVLISNALLDNEKSFHYKNIKMKQFNDIVSGGIGETNEIPVTNKYNNCDDGEFVTTINELIKKIFK